MRTPNSRVRVAVSFPMVRLRETQSQLNRFFWSTELSYGFLLTSADPRLTDRRGGALAALDGVESLAWYPNVEGRAHYEATLEEFSSDLRSNTGFLFRAVSILWYSAFEQYMEERLKPQIGRWMPLLSAFDKLATKKFGPTIEAVLYADINRILRNKMVHAHDELPKSVRDDAVENWIAALAEPLQNRGIPAQIPRQVAQRAIQNAQASTTRARAAGQNLPIDYFYMLFSFGYLDTLAFQIEEALQPERAPTHYWVKRARRNVRRVDLILPS